jgi:hypothetical protein
MTGVADAPDIEVRPECATDGGSVMSKKALGGAGLAGVVMFGTWSTMATPVCSCVPAGDSLRHQIGAHPVQDPPDAVRQAFLARLPVGTTEEALFAFLQGSNHSLDRCVAQGARTVCRVAYRENFWGQTGYEIDARFDAGRKLQDVRFARF